jgi:proprotein convertase subtilisin/kexin type 5
MNYFYLNNECLVACPNNYYADRSLRQCIACSTGCTTCFGTGATSCTVCSSTYFLQIGLTTCAQTCNAGEFANSLNNQCAICNSVCATCTSLNVCQSCQSVNGIAYFLNGTTCTATCPSNQFGQLSNYHCVACTDGCATCFGAGLSSCYSCGVSSGSVNYYLIYGTDICSQTCPDGQYANSTSFLCLLCSGSCKTCSATPTYCLTCGLSPYGYAVYLYSNQCLMNCPNSFWGNPSTNNCDACTPGCVTCFGSGLSACTVCGSDASSNVYYKHIGNTVCGTTCPNGQFTSASIPNLCQPCSSVCVTCQGTAENCTSSTCAENYYFLTNECLVSCPNNYYADRSLRQCIGCTTGCTTCFGTGTTSCTVCSSTYFLQIGLTTCAQTCNAG